MSETVKLELKCSDCGSENLIIDGMDVSSLYVSKTRINIRTTCADCDNYDHFVYEQRNYTDKIKQEVPA